MNKPAVFYFHLPFNNVSASVDRDGGVIKGVAIITGGVTAKGHNLEVDDTTLDQIVKCGKAKGRVQVKLNHKDPQAMQSICGYVANFRRQGNKVLGDWFLLKTHDEYEAMLERAERIPDLWGLSAAFSGPPEGEKVAGGKRAARCEELLAVDCVPMPAANPNGLFEALVDSPGNLEMGIQQTPAAEPTMAELLAAIRGVETKVNARFDAIEARQEAIEESLAGDQPLSEQELQELLAQTDEQLAEQGISREQVQATLDAVYGDAAPGDTAGDAAAAAAAGQGQQAAQAATAQLSALRARMVALEQKLGADAASQELGEVMTAFDTLEEKYNAVVELAAQKDGRITSLERALRLQGAKTASPNGASLRMFSAENDEDDAEGRTTFEKKVAAATIEFSKADPKLTPAAAKSKAVRHVIKTDPRCFAEHRAASGSVELADQD